MITPKQASETLTIPASTLRRWSKEFSEHLSAHEAGKHREYSTSDLDTLREIRDHLDDGLNYADVHKRLNAIEQPSSESKALLLIEDYTRMLEEHHATIQALTSDIEDLKKWKDEMQEYNHLTFIKRIFKRPPQA